MRTLTIISLTLTLPLFAHAQIEPKQAAESGADLLAIHNQHTPVQSVEDFRVVMDGDHAQITWVGHANRNIRGFRIERSSNGHQYETVQFVASEGGVEGKTEFLEMDHNPAPGVNYYRIRQVLFDGQESMTHAVIARNNLMQEEDELYDEFGNLKVKFDFSGFENEETLVLLRDKKGNDYYSKIYIIDLPGKERGVRLEPELPVGEYLITASSNDTYLSHRLTIE